MTGKVQSRYINLSPFKGKIHKDYDYPSFINQLVHWVNRDEFPKFEVIHDGRNRVGKISFSSDKEENIDLIIKEFRLKGIHRLKSAVGPSKARRAWDGAMAMGKRGLNTPKPAAFLERPKFPGVKEGIFITEFLEDSEEIRYLLLNSKSEKLENLVKSLAEYASLCHARGIIHRDLSDGNVLAKQNKKGDYIFYLIDTNRIRTKTRPGILRRIKSLIRLGIPKELQAFFLEIYTGKKPVVRIWWIWYRLNKSIFEIYLRLKKFLRVKKLAEVLRIQ